MFDQEQAIRIAEAARHPLYRMNGKPAAYTTVRDHMLRGVLTKGGKCLHLEWRRRGAQYVTTNEAIVRFHERLTHGLDADQPTPTEMKRAHAPPTSGSRRAESEGVKCSLALILAR